MSDDHNHAIHQLFHYVVMTALVRSKWHDSRNSIDKLLLDGHLTGTPDEVFAEFSGMAGYHLHEVMTELLEKSPELRTPGEGTATRLAKEAYFAGWVAGRVMEEIQVVRMRDKNLLVTTDEPLPLPGS